MVQVALVNLRPERGTEWLSYVQEQGTSGTQPEEVLCQEQKCVAVGVFDLYIRLACAGLQRTERPSRSEYFREPSYRVLKQWRSRQRDFFGLSDA